MRARGERSADDRDVLRELQRQRKRAHKLKGDPQPVQVAGHPLDAEEYARWRRRMLRRGAVTTAPEVDPARYALVLYAFPPSATQQFVRHGAGTHLTPPTVGSFLPGVDPPFALLATLTGWIELYGRPVTLAPPLIRIDRNWHVADLGLDWELPPHHLTGR